MWSNLLGRLVPQPTILCLTTVEHISCETFSAEEHSDSSGCLTASCILWAGEGGLHQRPTASKPVAVAAIDQLVGSASEPTLGCVLPGREPGQQCIHVKKSRQCFLRISKKTQTCKNTESIGTMRLESGRSGQTSFVSLAP
jgi:hypothetical protein